MKRFQFILICSLLVLALAGCNAPTQPAPTGLPATAAPNVENTFTPAAPLPSATQPAPTPEPPTPAAPERGAWIAYIGSDGNLWLAHRASGEQRQVSSEAAGLLPPGDQAAVTFAGPQWSSDGQLLAFTRQVQTPLPDRMDYQTSLWVYDLADGHARTVLEDANFILYSWQPGRHVIAYTEGTDPNYFTGRGQVDARLAKGVRGLYVDSGEIVDLVQPGRGFHLLNPHWSPDGSLLCFEEVAFMEGRGAFACFDFKTSQYLAWERPIGDVSFAPNGQQVAYDYLTYAPSGEERIYLNDTRASDEIAFAPLLPNGYSYNPVFSPQGDRIAYIGEVLQASGSRSTVLVQGLQDAQPREVGMFDQPGWLSWTPDGQQLLLTIGPFDNSQVILVDVNTGAVTPVAQGVSPAHQP